VFGLEVIGIKLRETGRLGCCYFAIAVVLRKTSFMGESCGFCLCAGFWCSVIIDLLRVGKLFFILGLG
jgi:hypothetical protein